MNKKCFILHFVLFFMAFFFFDYCVIKGEEITISQHPSASEITYGEPLYMSTLTGGVSSVEGDFIWKDELTVLEAGNRKAEVCFVSKENDEVVVFEVDIVVKPRRVFLKFEKELRKKYDGKKDFNLDGYVVNGIIDKDVYVSGEAIGTLESEFVGKNIKVNISGLELKGDKVNNYFLDLDSIVVTVHPNHLSVFGEDSDIYFIDDIYVDNNSVFKISKNENELSKQGFVYKDGYNLNVVSGESVIDVSGKILVKVKIDGNVLKDRRIKIFNYYKGQYNELNYQYKDGYVIYNCEGLGSLIIMQKKANLLWLYFIISGLVCFVIVIIIKIIVAKRNKINRYKSLKRRKDYEN